MQVPPQPPQVFVQVPPPPPIRGGSPSAIYEAYNHQRRVLSDQLERLEDQREELSDQLRQPNIATSSQRGIEQRITALDQRIEALDRQIADADAAVARAAAVPGAVIERPDPPERGPPEEFWVLSGLFMVIVLLPLTIAYARRIWRRGAAVVTSLPQDIYDRFTRVEQSLDSIAVEVERIGEGQRFLTRLHAEQRGLGAGAAERLQPVERDKEAQGRRP